MRPKGLEEAIVHYSTVASRFQSIRLGTKEVFDRHRTVHTLLVYVPQTNGRNGRVLFEFRVENSMIKQREYDDALRGWLADRSRYSWTEDPTYQFKNHGRADVARVRDRLVTTLPKWAEEIDEA